jgi:hypothetical protein
MRSEEVQESPAKNKESEQTMPGGFNSGHDARGNNAQSPEQLVETPKKPENFAASTPTFEFSFKRQDNGLGDAAKKMMEDLREEAARIKKQLEAERDAEKEKGIASGSMNVNGRKIAQPKGKTGRFSDVHMAEFKKMDSIAHHPSSFRARTQGLMVDEPRKSLKRSKSKAQLDDTTPNRPALSTRKLARPADEDAIDVEFINPSPLKRVKKRALLREDAIGSISRDSPKQSQISIPRHLSTTTQSSEHFVPTAPYEAATPTLKRSKSVLPLATPTPMKHSLARTHSVKSLKAFTPVKQSSPSTSSIIMPKSESNRFLSGLANFGRMVRHPSNPKVPKLKSALKQPSNWSLQADYEKDLASVPGTPQSSLLRSPSPRKVAFTPDVIARQNRETSPSVVKSASKKQSPSAVSQNVEVPRPRPILKATSVQPATIPGNFTFRAGSPVKFGGQGGQTIRQVSSNDAVSFPTAPTSEPSSLIRLRGMSAPINAVPTLEPQNKKRRRESAESLEPPTKKSKPEPPSSPSKISRIKLDSSRIPRWGSSGASVSASKGRGILSLARLNALASPKKRADREGSKGLNDGLENAGPASAPGSARSGIRKWK